MRRCLITGCGGFIGSHLAERLLKEAWSVYGTVRRRPSSLDRMDGRLTVIECDILDALSVEQAVREAEPDVVFHLAAQSSPSASWRQPEPTFRVNVFGTLYLLQAMLAVCPDATLVAVTSSAVYGASDRGDTPIKEHSPLRPSSPYGVSKAAADMLAELFWRTYGLRVIRARPFFISGPRKLGDVCSDFCRGVVETENQQRPSLAVGNLEAVRDFLHVRDAVEALLLLAEKGQPGEAYNICSGTGTSVSDLLQAVIAAAGVPAEVYRDPELDRPLDDPITVGDRSLLSALGWQPKTTIREMVRDTLEFWRQEAVHATQGAV
ncbi:MAG: GDP-mannose 4,6-dehydratase [Dehalococcoidia bacterium]|nr:GDP-mannose 4,6-dehydratase [Dehalococcoidia bacterium]